MKNFNLIVVTVITSLIASGCTSNSVKDRLVQAEEARQAVENERVALEQKKRELEFESAPEWFISPPSPDATGIYGVGSSSSANLGFAIKSARLRAEMDVGKQMKQEISGSERSYEQNGIDGNYISQSTFLIDKIIDAVPVVGYQVIDTQVPALNGKHEAYVLIKLPYKEFNRVLQSQMSETQSMAIKDAFTDLERRLDNRRQMNSQPGLNEEYSNLDHTETVPLN